MVTVLVGLMITQQIEKGKKTGRITYKCVVVVRVLNYFCNAKTDIVLKFR